jgi:hypothetical protein
VPPVASMYRAVSVVALPARFGLWRIGKMD